jgi:hypothetical protein
MGIPKGFFWAVLAAAALMLAPAGAVANHDVTGLVSTGPAGGSGPSGAVFRTVSTDGSRVIFQTAEPLVAADTDAAIDIYERSNGLTTLLSTGPTGGNGANGATFAGASKDATRVVFRTTEQLVAGDTDSFQDLYQRAAGVTTQISTGPAGGNAATPSVFSGISDDGAHVFFQTADPLVATDTDAFADVYDRSAGTTTHISTGLLGGNGAFPATFDGATPSGSHAYFHTDEPLEISDFDERMDVYQRTGGVTTHLSIGPAGGNGNLDFDYDAFFDGVSTDGSKVWLDTNEALTFDDTDASFDIYERSGASIARISVGSTGGNGAYDAFFDAASANGSRVFFDTLERLSASDTDGGHDIYERAGGATTLMSVGPAGGNGGLFSSFAAITSDGLNLFWTSPERLTADDTDSTDDVYQRVGGTTTRVSAGGTGGNAEVPSAYVGASADASRVFFSTAESLSSADGDAWTDLYERNAGATTFISKGPNSANEDFLTPLYGGASADGQKVFFETAESLLNIDTDTAQDVYTATLGTSGGFARPKGATPVRASMVPAFAPCASPNRQHAAPLVFGSCNPPVQASPLLTIGSPDANGQAAGSNNNFVQLTVLGVPGGPEDSDVQLSASFTDVRKTSDLSDYSGELQVSVDLEMTDRDPLNSLASTIATLPFNATIPCTPTVSTTIGSTCSVTTTADTLVPGMVPEAKRLNWELGRVTAMDGGLDNLAATADNNVFAVQGLFVP